MALWEKAQSSVKATLDSLVSDTNDGIPGIVFASVDKTGSIIASHASGQRGLDSKEPMTMDTIFWIASCKHSCANTRVCFKKNVVNHK